MVPDSEFSEDFVKYMRNRMEISFHKYGPINDAYPERIDALKSASVRVDKYLETGNTEFLVDAANFMMIEFMLPSKRNAFFKGTDSNESPGRYAYRAGGFTQRPNDKV